VQTTLVTSVTLGTTDEAHVTMRDVLTQVTDHGPFRLIDFRGKTQSVEVKVSEAERIALIEALGGKP
jgi:hypothetical protein